MKRTAEFRRVMTIAGQVARQQSEPVSALHVAFAYAACLAPGDSTAHLIQAFGDERGWGASTTARPVFRRLLRHRRPVQYDPAIRRAVERAAAGGSPDIRTMLAALLNEGGLDPLREAVERAGGDLSRWLTTDA
ncbi:hypothetical protein [Rathayibacter sp. VKM Ac-2760]|uniref:hypothetical protein n=1 Tax=Rathayibacter sp. VKM Ac-2760 TaxID=2609253 RepID=UPI001316A841|nr:hypothetical protein [Rathayibacter sp. VKM Ac-2760]QHC58323.1 hypothetical protein GSU72_07010 [Rathayibacter sp. VKM Ac-2760]